VVLLNPVRFQQDGAGFPLAEDSAAFSQGGIVEGLDYRGVPVLADIRPVPNSPWFLISKIDREEIHAPLEARLWQTFLIVGLSILVSGLWLSLVWRQQRLLVYRTKANASEALHRSEANFADMFQTISVGISYTTLGGEVLAINRSLERILEIPSGEIVGRNILTLTRDLLALPQKSLLRASLPLRKPVCLLPDMDCIGFRTPV
jgi:PAS domain-containing protein